MEYVVALVGDGWPVRAVLVAAALAFAVIVYDAVMALVRRSRHLRPAVDTIRQPGRVLVLGVMLLASLTVMELPASVSDVLRRGLTIGIVGVAGFAIARFVGLAFDRAILPYVTRDDAVSRARRTQLDFFRRVTLTGIAGLTVAFCLTTIPAVRAMGLSLFASAGVAGIVIGLAAQPTISNFIAGIQIAMTQPIRISDVVVVENEWGRIEEISSTYVVVAIWDERRLILPLSYFLQKPFQNWTRESSQLLQPVFLYVDYSLPVAAFRTRERAYPYGWQDRGAQNCHHAYDVVRLVRFGWPHMSDVQKAFARAQLVIVLARTIRLSINSVGEVDTRPYNRVAEAYYFCTSLLDDIGYFRRSRNFWSNLEFDGDELREKLLDQLKDLPGNDPMIDAARRKLELRD